MSIETGAIRACHRANTFKAVPGWSIQAAPSSKPPAAIAAQTCSKSLPSSTPGRSNTLRPGARSCQRQPRQLWCRSACRRRHLGPVGKKLSLEQSGATSLRAIVKDLGRFIREGPSNFGLGTHQQIERDEVRDHQHGHVDDRDRVCGTQLPRQRRKSDLDGVVIVKDDVDYPHEIEGDDKRPKERTYPYREKRQDGQ